MVKRKAGKGRKQRQGAANVSSHEPPSDTTDPAGTSEGAASDAPRAREPAGDAPDDDADAAAEAAERSDAPETSDGGAGKPPDEDEDDPLATPAVAAFAATDAHRPVAAPALPAHWLLRFDHAWTWLETRLLFLVLGALILLLCMWISINGMKDPYEGGSKAGLVFRAVFGAAVLGLGTRFALRKSSLSDKKRAVIQTVAVILGCALAPLWRRVGISYFSTWYAWLDGGSSIALFGGLHGISTRLTVLLALLGGSLAAGSGSHINIDVVVRFLPVGWRRIVHIVGSLATAAVCLVASWAFFNYVAIESYHARIEMTEGERVSHVFKQVGDQFFLWRKQVGFDFGGFARVIQGKEWDDDGQRGNEVANLHARLAREADPAKQAAIQAEIDDVVAHPTQPRMTGREWNEWLDDAGFDDRFGAGTAASLHASDGDLDKPRSPFVPLPQGGSTKGLLVPTMNLLFPFGLLMIALRLLLRALLVSLGLKSAEPEGAEHGAPPEEPQPQKETA